MVVLVWEGRRKGKNRTLPPQSTHHTSNSGVKQKNKMGGACSNSAARTTADPSSSPTSNGSVVPAPTDIHHPNYSHQLPSGAVLVYHQYHYVMALLHDDKEKICHHFEKLKHDSLLKFADLQLPPGAADFSNLPPSLVSAENLEYGFATWKDEKLPEFDTLPYRQKLPLPEFERYTLGELFGWSHVFSMQSASFIEAMNCEKYKVKEYGGFYKSGTIGEKFPHTFWNDLSFGWQKGAGANPFQLKKVTDAKSVILSHIIHSYHIHHIHTSCNTYSNGTKHTISTHYSHDVFVFIITHYGHGVCVYIYVVKVYWINLMCQNYHLYYQLILMI